MKVFIVAALLLLVAAESLYAQNNGYYQYQSTPEGSKASNQEIYVKKIHSYEKMKYWGLSFLITGGSAAFTGLGLVLANPQNTDYYDPTAYNLGKAFLEGGIALAAPGAVLALIGATQESYYRKKMAGLTLGMATKGAGLSLTYRF